MDRPTAATVRALTPQPPVGTNYAAWGYPAPANPGDPDPLQPTVDAANAYIEQMTCRCPLESINGPECSLEPLVNQAVTLRVQQWLWWTTECAVQSGTSDIASFSAGSYSETRRDRGRGTDERWVNPWPALNELLWLIMTPECREKWIAIVDPDAPDVPDFAVSSPDWSAFSSPGDFSWDPLFTTDWTLNQNRLYPEPTEYGRW